LTLTRQPSGFNGEPERRIIPALLTQGVLTFTECRISPA
jgi:hypothetical protein